jgi:hypothetical protein
VTDKLKIEFGEPRPIPVWGKEGEFYQNIDVNRDADDTHMGFMQSGEDDDGDWMVVCFDTKVGYDLGNPEGRGVAGWDDTGGTLEFCKTFIEYRIRYPELFEALEEDEDPKYTAPEWVISWVATNCKWLNSNSARLRDDDVNSRVQHLLDADDSGKLSARPTNPVDQAPNA